VDVNKILIGGSNGLELQQLNSFGFSPVDGFHDPMVEPAPASWATKDDGRSTATFGKMDGGGEDLGSFAVLPVAVMDADTNKPAVGKVASKESRFITFIGSGRSFGKGERDSDGAVLDVVGMNDVGFSTSKRAVDEDFGAAPGERKCDGGGVASNGLAFDLAPHPVVAVMHGKHATRSQECDQA